MHIKSLKIFCDVVGRKSFSQAARENGISQSGASQIVHQLEDRLGVKLIDRSKRPFVLTLEGEAYYQGCRQLVTRFSTLEENVRTLHQEVSGRVSVASIYSVGLSHMNRYVQAFLGLHPRASVDLEYQHPDRVYELVEHDQVDLGLVSYPKSSRAIKAVTWREERMVLACAPGNVLAGRGTISVDELDGQMMVGFVSQLRIRREIDRVLQRHGAEVTVCMEFDNIETIKRAVEINAGVSLLPEPTLLRETQIGSLIVVPLSGEPILRPLGIIHRRTKTLGTTASRFVQLLQEKAADGFGGTESGQQPPDSKATGNGELEHNGHPLSGGVCPALNQETKE